MVHAMLFKLVTVCYNQNQKKREDKFRLFPNELEYNQVLFGPMFITYDEASKTFLIDKVGALDAVGKITDPDLSHDMHQLVKYALSKVNNCHSNMPVSLKGTTFKLHDTGNHIEVQLPRAVETHDVATGVEENIPRMGGAGYSNQGNGNFYNPHPLQFNQHYKAWTMVPQPGMGGAGYRMTGDNLTTRVEANNGFNPYYTPQPLNPEMASPGSSVAGNPKTRPGPSSEGAKKRKKAAATEETGPSVFERISKWACREVAPVIQAIAGVVSEEEEVDEED